MARSYGQRAREERPRVRIDETKATKTLVVDETFASFYRPGEVATYCVWDAIAAPILWLPPTRRRRILILGLGGGSVARIARALAPAAEIVGVELDREVVRLARAHLALDDLGIQVEIADARVWLEEAFSAKKSAKKSAKGSAKKSAKQDEKGDTKKGRFDAILEDVFIGCGDEVHKPDWIPAPTHGWARALLSPGGVFVSNTLDDSALVAKDMREHFDDVASIEVDEYDNRVLAAGSGGLTGAALRRCVKASEVLRESLPILRFRSC